MALIRRTERKERPLAATAIAGGLRGQLLRGGLGTVGLNFTSIVLSLVTVVTLARLLGADEFGLYAFAMAVVTLLAIPVQLGLPQLLIRLCAIYKHRVDYASLKGLLVRANQTVLLLGVLMALLGAAALVLLPSARGWIFREPLLLALALMPLFGLIGIRGAVLRGLGHIVLSQLPESLIRPLLFLALLGFFWWLADGIGVLTAIRLNILATGVGFLAGAWILFRVLPPGVRRTSAHYRDGEWFASALPFLLIAGLQIIMQQTDILMLGFFVQPAEVGLYRVATQGAMLVTFSLTVVNAVIGPHVARAHDAGEQRQLQWLVLMAGRFALLGAAPLTLVYLVYGDRLLGLVFGAQFISGHSALAILAIGHFINVAMGCVGLILTMTGKAWHATFGVALSATLNVTLNLLLIPRFGLEGAALATALSLLVWNVLLSWWVYRLLGLVSSGFWFGRL